MNENNIAYICPKHQAERLKEYQDKATHEYDFNDYIKASIDCRNPDKDRMPHIESMWIQVKSVDQDLKTVTGVLANDPVRSNSKYKYGDKITVNFSEICDFLPQYYVDSVLPRSL